MLGPEWRKAQPINFVDDDDVELFLAIRADIDEVFLRARIIPAGTERNVNSYSVTALGKQPPERGNSSKGGPQMTNRLTDLNKWPLHVFQTGGTGSIVGSTKMTDINPIEANRQREDNRKRGVEGNRGGGPYVTLPTTPVNQVAETIGSVVPSPSSVLGLSSSVQRTSVETPAELAELWRYFRSGTNNNTAAATTYPPQAYILSQSTLMIRDIGEKERRSKESAPEYHHHGRSRTVDNSLQLTLAGAFVGSNLAQTENALLVGQSSSSSNTGNMSTSSDGSSDFVIVANTAISLIGDNMEPQVITDETNLPGSSNNPLEGIPVYVPGEGVRDKGKAIAGGEIVPTATCRPVIRVDGLHVMNEEPRVTPTMHERDAPPYFDDPIGEDELERALHDVDYEGDDIFVGRIFKNKEDCQRKLAIHAINHKFHFRYARSCPNVIIVVCVGDTCPWRVYATKMEESSRYEVCSAKQEHTCSVDARGNFHRQASTAVIGELMRSKYGVEGRGPQAFELQHLCRQEFSLHISYWKAWRAREIAMDKALGSAMGSYALVPTYFKLLKQANPNSVTGIKTEVDNTGVERFKYLFFSLDASARGYQYMRKVVVIDGTHLRNRYGGCLVAASAQDGNFQIFPLGFAIVNSENDEAWEWFLEKLSEIVPDEPELVFVSNRHSSIYSAIRKGHSFTRENPKREQRTLLD
ncbi:uncharacterized protein LOC112081428 [Eutrema salsugineum]|uniref:uncharacterized protein LOC112081428 n=1 Tax=Eutrema salsugineum TaxID=72664 RepID=UPI000CECFAF1|nr:uncharacterized protein LOC112081428 [Eutrema salsugineum]